MGSVWRNVAGGSRAGREFLDAVCDIFAFFRPLISAEREECAGVVLALEFETIENAVAVFDGGVGVVLSFFDRGRKDGAGDLRPGTHGSGVEETLGEEPDEDRANRGGGEADEGEQAASGKGRGGFAWLLGRHGGGKMSGAVEEANGIPARVEGGIGHVRGRGK